MADVFNSLGTQNNGSMSADDTILTFAGTGGVGPIAQMVNWAYTQQVSVIFEVGTRYNYLIRGRARGQLSIGSVIGPRGLIPNFYSKFGDVCNSSSNNINMEVGVGCGRTLNASRATFRMKTVVLLSVGGSTGAENGLINDQTSGMFMQLEMG